MNRAAHVITACDREPYLVRQLFCREVLMELVHQSLNDSGSVRTCAVAVHPSLGMNNVTDTGADTADHVVLLFQLGYERIHLGLVGHEELNVVPCGETEVSAAVLLSEITYLTDRLGRKDPRRSNPYCVYRSAALCRVHHCARSEDFMRYPFAVILFNYRR